MTETINLFAAAPDLMKEWQKSMTHLAAAANFDPTLTELVKVRASQINGCANCINMHATRTRVRRARPSSASTCCRPGARRLAIPTANAPRSAGPRR